jgi:hypothetical protein
VFFQDGQQHTLGKIASTDKPHPQAALCADLFDLPCPGQTHPPVRGRPYNKKVKIKKNSTAKAIKNMAILRDSPNPSSCHSK